MATGTILSSAPASAAVKEIVIIIQPSNWVSTDSGYKYDETFPYIDASSTIELINNVARTNVGVSVTKVNGSSQSGNYLRFTVKELPTENVTMYIYSFTPKTVL